MYEKKLYILTFIASIEMEKNVFCVRGGKFRANHRRHRYWFIVHGLSNFVPY